MTHDLTDTLFSLILLVMLIGNNREIMGEYVNGLWTNIVGWFTFAAMALATIAMFIAIGK